MAEHRITFTRHAAEMLTERNIKRDWVERTLTDPQSVEPDPSRDNVFRAYRPIAERDNRVLRVVYTQDKNEVRVLTSFFDRARR
jgi:hypothetical protein